MAIALDASTPAAVTANGTAKTTASFTPPANSLVVVCTSNDAASGGGADSTCTSSDSPAGGWTLLARAEKPTYQESICEVWYHYYASSPGAITVTTTAAQADGHQQVLVFTGADTAPGTAVIATSTSTSYTANVTTVSNNGWVWLATSSWQDHTFTAGASQTIQSQSKVTSVCSGAVQKMNATTATAGTVVTINGTTDAGTNNQNVIAFEIKAAVTNPTPSRVNAVTSVYAPSLSTAASPARVESTSTIYTPIPRGAYLVQSIGSANSNTNGTTLAVSFSGATKPQIGDLIVVSCARDNVATDPLTGDSISDTYGNSYTRVVAGSSVTTAAAGVVGVQFWCILTAAWAAGTNTITWTLPSRVSKAMDVDHYAFGGGTFVANGASATGTSTTGAPSAANTNPIAYDLVVGTMAAEHNVIPTGDSDTTNGSWSTIAGTGSAGGTATAKTFASTQYKVTTAAGTQTFNPTTASTDSVAILTAWTGVPKVTPTPSRVNGTTAIYAPSISLNLDQPARVNGSTTIYQPPSREATQPVALASIHAPWNTTWVTIGDLFPGAALSSIWTSSFGSPAVAGGKVTLTPTAMARHYARSERHSIDGTSVSVMVESTLSVATGSMAQFALWSPDMNWLGVMYYMPEYGTLYAELGGPLPYAFGNVAYNATTMKYWRFMHSGSTLYAQYSADMYAWTTLASTSVSSSGPLESLSVGLEAIGSSGNVAYSLFNTAPKYSTVTDDFPGSSLGAEWLSSNGSPVVASNTVTFSSTGSALHYIETQVHSLDNDSVTVKFNPSAVVGAGGYAGLFLQDYETSFSIANLYRWLDSNDLYTDTSSWPWIPANSAHIAYNSTTQAWLRLRHDGTTFFADYSADGLAWTNLGSWAIPGWQLRKTRLIIGSSGTSGTAVASKYNLLPVAVTPTRVNATTAVYSPTITATATKVATVVSVKAAIPYLYNVSEDFASSLPTNWTAWGDTAWSSGRVAITGTTNGGYLDGPPLALVDSSFVCEVDGAAAAGATGSGRIAFNLWSHGFYHYVGMYADPTGLNVIDEAGVRNIRAYNTTNDRWWRIRESGGTIYYDTSPDGSSWSNLTTTTGYVALRQAHLPEFSAWSLAGGTAVAYYDNFSWTGTGALLTTVTVVSTRVEAAATIYAPRIDATAAPARVAPPAAAVYTPAALTSSSTITPARVESTSTFFQPPTIAFPIGGQTTVNGPTLTATAVATPSLVAPPTSSVYAPTLTASATPTPTRVDATTAVYTPTPAATATVTAARIDPPAAAVYVPTGMVTITASRVDATTAVYLPTTTVTILPTLVQPPTAAVYAPTLTGSATSTPSRVDGSTAVYAPGASAAASPARVASTTAVYLPTLTASATITPGVVATGGEVFPIPTTGTFPQATTLIYAPTPSAAVSLPTTRVDATSSIYLPTLTSSATAAATQVAGSSQVYAPTPTATASLTASRVDATTTIPTPGAAVTPTIAPVLATTAVYQPTLDTPANATASRADATTQVYSPTLTADATATAALVTAQTAVPDPTLSSSATALADLVGGSTVVYLPSPTVSEPGTAPADRVDAMAEVFTPAVLFSGAAAAERVEASSSIPTPTLTGSAEATPGVVNAEAVVFDPTLIEASSGGDTTVPVARVEAAAAVFAPAPFGSSTFTPARVAGSTAVFLPVLTASGAVTAVRAEAAAGVYLPALRSSGTAAPDSFVGRTTIPQPGGTGTAVAAPQRLDSQAQVFVPVFTASAVAAAVQVLAAVSIAMPQLRTSWARVFNGTTWIGGKLHYWHSGAWVPVRMWDGSEWRE